MADQGASHHADQHVNSLLSQRAFACNSILHRGNLCVRGHVSLAKHAARGLSTLIDELICPGFQGTKLRLSLNLPGIEPLL